MPRITLAFDAVNLLLASGFARRSQQVASHYRAIWLVRADGTIPGLEVAVAPGIIEAVPDHRSINDDRIR